VMHTRAFKLSVLVESYTTEEYASLPLKVALLLRDRVRDKKAYTAIAKSYDIPVGTVRSRIHRARAKIARLRAVPD
jgi:DNA-directed RNA polymerase specialized sigma24 family protein